MRCNMQFVSSKSNIRFKLRFYRSVFWKIVLEIDQKQNKSIYEKYSYLVVDTHFIPTYIEAP